jgi:cyclophilin family peptidyl-prolyl cis-trans isomerase
VTDLNGDYAAFGRVVTGMEVVDAFAQVPMAYNSMDELASPKTPIVIAKAEIVPNDQ